MRRMIIMANPNIVTCTLATWVKVATNVNAAVIHRKLTGPRYYHTYRLTGAAAPSDLSDAVPAFTDGDVLQYEHPAGIDIYIYTTGKAGSVRVDA